MLGRSCELCRLRLCRKTLLHAIFIAFSFPSLVVAADLVAEVDAGVRVHKLHRFFDGLRIQKDAEETEDDEDSDSDEEDDKSDDDDESSTEDTDDGVIKDVDRYGGNDARIDHRLFNHWLKLDKRGIDIDGTWIYDESVDLAGGLLPGHWAGQNLLFLDFYLDLDTMFDWEGGLIGLSYMNHRGSTGYRLTGDVQDFNGLDVGILPNRSQFYELWIQQYLFDEAVKIRFGKMNACNDFAYSNAAVLFGHGAHGFSPTLYNDFPAYPESGTGVNVFLYSDETFYAGFGFYDGRIGGNTTPTGRRGPQFNSQYFYIAEAGVNFQLWDETRVGRIAFGGWRQTGKLVRFDGGDQNGEAGLHWNWDQTLWLEEPEDVNQGINAFFMGGTGDPNTNFYELSLSTGISWQGLIPRREFDSFGIGLAFSDLTDEPGANNAVLPLFNTGIIPASEIAYQSRYHLQATELISFQVFVTYIQDPGQDTNIPNAWTTSFRLLVDF